MSLYCPTRELSYLRIGVLIASLLLIVAAGCRSERTYELRGRVAGFGDDGRTLIVEHEDVPGLMPAMTMPFDVRQASVVDDLRVGDAVSFRLTMSGDQAWIDNVSKLPDDAVAQHPAGARDEFQSGMPPLLEHGDELPEVVLTTHADTTIRLSDLRGQHVVLTFIYTRCPIPDFCPLMSQHFARIQDLLGDVEGLPVRLLSISFDPSNDTPAVLRTYSERYTDDLSNWTFATGDSTVIHDLAARFGVFYRSDADQILHNLVTALIDTQGTVRRLWRGNEWQPQEVMELLREVEVAG